MNVRRERSLADYPPNGKREYFHGSLAESGHYATYNAHTNEWVRDQ